MRLYKRYYAPYTLDEALNLLAEHAPRARIIAGGTDLLVELERRQRDIDTIIDITRIPEQPPHHQTRSATRAGGLACGCPPNPQSRHRRRQPHYSLACQRYHHATHRAGCPHKQGTRTIPLHEFYTGVRQTVMQPDEMLVDIAFPALLPNQHGAFAKLGLRRAQAISVVNVAIVMTADRNASGGICPPIFEACIALGAVAPTIIRAPEAERALVGPDLSDEHLAHVAELAAKATSVPQPPTAATPCAC